MTAGALALSALTAPGAHLVSTQATLPTVAAGAAAGSGAVLSMAAGSTDARGSVTVTVGTNASVGVLATVTFNSTYSHIPTVIVGQTANTWNFGTSYYVGTVTVNSFQIDVAVANALNDTIPYHVIG